MKSKIFGFATLLYAVASPAFAAPSLTAVPGGVQAGNWVWNIDITPDLTLIPDSSGTPMAVELGFRLTGAQLLGATIADPTAWDTPNPGRKIFGWEAPDPLFPNPAYGFGLQTNLGTGEIFAAYGSRNFTIPGATHFLKVIATGPSAGPPSFSSTIQWLGVYGTGSSNGRITQISGKSGSTYLTTNYDTFAGSATQSIPEPSTLGLVAIGAIVTTIRLRRRRTAPAANG